MKTETVESPVTAATHPKHVLSDETRARMAAGVKQYWADRRAGKIAPPVNAVKEIKVTDTHKPATESTKDTSPHPEVELPKVKDVVETHSEPITMSPPKEASPLTEVEHFKVSQIRIEVSTESKPNSLFFYITKKIEEDRTSYSVENSSYERLTLSHHWETRNDKSEDQVWIDKAKFLMELVKLNIIVPDNVVDIL